MPRPAILHRRIGGGAVDVVEAGRRLLPIVRTAARALAADVKGLEVGLAGYLDRSAGGLLLYGGVEVFP